MTTETENRKIVFIGFYILFVIFLTWISYDLIKNSADLSKIKQNGISTTATVQDIVVLPIPGKPKMLDYYFEFKNDKGETVRYRYNRAITGTWDYKVGDIAEITFQKGNPSNFFINSKVAQDFKTSMTIIVCLTIALLIMTFRKTLKKLV